MTYYQWYPANGEPPLTFQEGGPLRMVSADGLGGAPTDVLSVKAPGQYGTTPTDVTLEARVIGFALVCESADLTASMALRRQLARAFASHPLRASGGSVPQGIFRVVRPGGQPVLDILAVPRHSPHLTQAGPRAVLADIELYCAYPYFRETSDQYQLLQSNGGFVWSLVFPLDMPTFNITSEVNNMGDLPAAPLLRLYGDCIGARLDNLTTGEALVITPQIIAGDYIEVQTEFGQKAVTLVHAGVRTNALAKLNLAVADFWWLEPGINLVRFSASTNTSGKAELLWRARYAGV